MSFDSSTTRRNWTWNGVDWRGGLDWLLTLPKEPGVAHRQWTVEYEKEKAMHYMTS